MCHGFNPVHVRIGEGLTPCQRTALLGSLRPQSDQFWGMPRFNTGDALRKLGLIERHTNYVIRAEFANEDGVQLQYKRRARQANAVHEWWLTSRGQLVRDYLTEKNREENAARRLRQDPHG